MTAHVIVRHEDWQQKPYMAFLAEVVGSALPKETEVEGELLAYVNHGRWIAECPDGCGFAVVTSRDKPVFFCRKCRNATVGGKFRRVVYPPDIDKIEYHLLKRPARHPLEAPTRNWKPGEAIADLIRENAAHGVV